MRHTAALNGRTLTSLSVLLLAFSAVRAEDPGDWSFKHYDKFMASRFQEAPEMRSGERISVLIFGDYQCETRLVLARHTNTIQVETVLAVGSSIRDQLSRLRLEDSKASEEEIYDRVKVERERNSSERMPSLADSWKGLEALRLPVLPGSGFISPAVWYQVSATSGGEHRFEFAVPVEHAPNTGYLGGQGQVDYPLAAWVRSVLTMLGGRSARAADGGDCAVHRSPRRRTGTM